MPETLVAVRPDELVALRSEIADLRAMQERLLELLLAPQTEEGWLSVNAYAARAGCHRRTVLRQIAAGELEAKGTGRARMIRLR